MSKYGVTLTLAIVCVGLPALGGCNRASVHQRQYLAMLDAEKRSLEDIIYRQEDEYELILKQLRKCRSERDAHKIGSGVKSGNSPAVDIPKVEVPGVEVPGVEVPGVEVPGVEVPGVEVPGVEIPGVGAGSAVEPNPNPNAGPSFPAPANPRRSNSVPSNSVPSNSVPANSVPAGQAPPTNRGPLPPPTGPQANIPVDNSISHIVINRLETRGIDLDRQIGDDGIRIVVEPRNKDEVFLPQFGRISVVLLDPQESGEQARIARWDFDAVAVRQALRDSRRDKGIHLEVKWSEVPPSHSHLRLFVRMETETGDRFEADREIFVQLPQRTAHWTPRADQTRFADADSNAPERTAGNPDSSIESNSPRATQQPRWSPERPIH